jgi:hypothetical protein
VLAACRLVGPAKDQFRSYVRAHMFTGGPGTFRLLAPLGAK